MQDTGVVPGEAAVRGVAGATAVQGRVLHLREARQGAAQEVPRQGAQRRRRPQGAHRQGTSQHPIL